LVIILSSMSISLISCIADGADGEGMGSVTNFDRAVLLESLASGLIIPNFTALRTSVDALSTATDVFIADANEVNLLALQAAWEQAVIDHQHCSAFGFGPANLPLGAYATVLGVFPANAEGIEANIENENFNLAASFDRDVRGFYALEYLIFGDIDEEGLLIENYDIKRNAYIRLITDELQTTVDQIVDEWNDSYKTSFIANDGSSAGSSISLLYNEFVKDYENLKNFKVELPAGLTAGQSSSDPKLVEAYYSGISAELIQEHFESTKNLWKGLSRDGKNLVGFEENLESLVGGVELIASTKIALQEIQSSIDALPQGELSANVDSPEMATLRDKLQANTANFKSSMSSLLGISITFNSGDGD